MSAAWTSESIIDDAVYDGAGNCIGKIDHPPLTPAAMSERPCRAIMGTNKQRFDLIVAVSYTGQVSTDVLYHAFLVLDQGGAVCLLAWSSVALNETCDALLSLFNRLPRGGRA